MYVILDADHRLVQFEVCIDSFGGTKLGVREEKCPIPLPYANQIS
jgi:hypothetical protein